MPTYQVWTRNGFEGNHLTREDAIAHVTVLTDMGHMAWYEEVAPRPYLWQIDAMGHELTWTTVQG